MSVTISPGHMEMLNFSHIHLLFLGIAHCLSQFHEHVSHSILCLLAVSYCFSRGNWLSLTVSPVVLSC